MPYATNSPAAASHERSRCATRTVITPTPATVVEEVVPRHSSGLTAADANGPIVGMIAEADTVRRSDIGAHSAVSLY